MELATFRHVTASSIGLSWGTLGRDNAGKKKIQIGVAQSAPTSSLAGVLGPHAPGDAPLRAPGKDV